MSGFSGTKDHHVSDDQRRQVFHQLRALGQPLRHRRHGKDPLNSLLPLLDTLLIQHVAFEKHALSYLCPLGLQVDKIIQGVD